MTLTVSDITQSRSFANSLDNVLDTASEGLPHHQKLAGVFGDPSRLTRLKRLLCEKHEKIRLRQNEWETILLTTACLNRVKAVLAYLTEKWSDIDQDDLDADAEVLIDQYLAPEEKIRDHRIPLTIDESPIIDVIYNKWSSHITVRTADQKTYLLQAPHYKKWELYVWGEYWRVVEQNGNVVTAYDELWEKKTFELRENGSVVDDMERTYFHHEGTIIYRGKSSSDGLYDVYVEKDEKRKSLWHQLQFANDEPIRVRLGSANYLCGFTFRWASELLTLEWSGEDIRLTPHPQMIQLDEQKKPVFGRISEQIGDMTDFILGTVLPEGKTILVDRRSLRAICAYPTDQIERITNPTSVPE